MTQQTPLITKSRSETWKEYWDRQKGKVAVVTTATTIGAMLLNRHNLDVCRQFLQEKDMLDEFENWLTPFIIKGEIIEE